MSEKEKNLSTIPSLNVSPFFFHLGERLSDGVDLGGVAAALDPDPDVDVGKALLAQQENRLLQLELEGARLHQLQGPPVDLHIRGCC
jgi:hypothetical protein